MTDAQFGLLVATLTTIAGGFVAFLKWAIGQWREERKVDREQRSTEIDREREDRRDDRQAVIDVSEGVDDIQLTLAALLERDRRRDDRKKRESMQPTTRGVPVPKGQWDDAPSTDVHEIKRVMRNAVIQSRQPTPPAGSRTPRGTTHDEDR